MGQDWIRIRGARQHQLKNLSLDLPKNRFIVITGPSGSGKSSLAFDTLFAEGQRRYMQSLSAYARQFLEQLQKPEVDSIEGLSPTIAIEQRTSTSSPRSIVATTTEIHDYLRLLYAACGQRHHPKTGKPLHRLSAQEIVDQILTSGKQDEAFLVMAPVARQQKGTLQELLEHLSKQGYVRARIDGIISLLEDPPKLKKGIPHEVDVIIDRLKMAEGVRERLTESVELGLKTGHGTVLIHWPERKQEADHLYSNQEFDPETGYLFPELKAQHFSFNSPLGACPTCAGLGTQSAFDADLVISDPSLSLAKGAITPWARGAKRLVKFYQSLLQDLARSWNVSMDKAWQDLPEAFRQFILHGSEKKAPAKSKNADEEAPFKGVLAQLQDRYEKSESELSRVRLRAWMSPHPCPTCLGARFQPHILAVTLGKTPSPDPYLQPKAKDDTENAPQSIFETASGNIKGLNISQFCDLSIHQARNFLTSIRLSDQQLKIAREVIREIEQRLKFLEEVGVGYLTLNRPMQTLSGGEAQRIRLATQIGSGLTGVLYVLDEPSIGLHPSDQQKLLHNLLHLRDLGNTVVVVEHDEATIRAADHIVDMGPAAGLRGGQIVAQGSLEEILAHPRSSTGSYLRGERRVGAQRKPREPSAGWLSIVGARENNLKNITARFPLGAITCVTGASGSGKSTLVNDILSRALFRHFYHSKDKPGAYQHIEGLQQLDKIIAIDQSPIGRTPRSNALTYTGAFNAIRDLFAQLPASKVRGYTPSRFSFNTKGGRCEHCEGEGFKIVEMNFLPDVYVPCPVCKGDRFNRQTLEVTYKGHTIADVLRLTVQEGLTLFQNIPPAQSKLEALAKVGLGYLPMGQAATSLSGGEAQRIKLAAELAKKATGRTLFILDEPTTGLHFSDIELLIQILYELCNLGNTIILIEHQLDLIRCADHIIDLGPGGGVHGGEIIATGTPEEIAQNPTSLTGRCLRESSKQQEIL